MRNSFPNARITDVVAMTPVGATVLIDSPGSGPPSGFVQFGARYTGSQGIVLFGVGAFSGVQYPVDQTLSLTQAADKFATLSSAPALLVGRIDRDTGQCSAIENRNADTARATASIFKPWVLAGLGEAIVEGSASSSEILPMLASEIAPGGTINAEPLNTLFPVSDLATLMMGISDNTATDLLHQRVGRAALDQIVLDYGVMQPDLLTPFLGLSEQFHVFLSFDLPTAQSYVNGTQPFKYQFLQNSIEPLGPNTGGAFFHPQLLTDGTWRASPFDVCRAFAQLRRLPQGSEALRTVDNALGAGIAQPDIRGDWDRVWYKGGSLASGAGLHVLTHAWMLENAGDDPYVVVAMSNSSTGGIDQFFVQSVTGRMLELLSLMP